MYQVLFTITNHNVQRKLTTYDIQLSVRSSRVIGDSFPEFGHIDSWE
jgi:hypothetical protein